MTIAFGPIHSRRFGRSLGVNHVPGKACTYSCVYCQLGPTPRTSIERRAFYPPEVVIDAVKRKANDCAGQFDVISFVPDGEPTLDINLGAEIRGVLPLGYPVAVITNGSLLWDPEVRADLMAADIVSVEVDTTDEEAWRRIDRPSPALSLGLVLDGVRAFAREYRGQLWTQTMLLEGFTPVPAAFLAEIRPHRVFLSVPTRPPADPRVRAASELTLARAAALIPNAEVMTQDPGTALVRSRDELLAVLAVHPLRERSVDPSLIDWTRVERVEHDGDAFLRMKP